VQFADNQLFLQTLADDDCCFDVAQLHQLGIDDDDMADNVFVPAAQSTGDDFNLLSVSLPSLHVVFSTKFDIGQMVTKSNMADLGKI